MKKIIKTRVMSSIILLLNILSRSVDISPYVSNYLIISFSRLLFILRWSHIVFAFQDEYPRMIRFGNSDTVRPLTFRSDIIGARMLQNVTSQGMSFAKELVEVKEPLLYRKGTSFVDANVVVISACD